MTSVMTASRLRIAGSSIPLHDPQSRLLELDRLYATFSARANAFSADPANPHLCTAGCSHCCKKGAFFAVTLVEALRWALAIESTDPSLLTRARTHATKLLARQQQVFADGIDPADVPGSRHEESFSPRVARMTAGGASCPLLDNDLCSTYDGRPFMCRAYGYPVDSFAVDRGDAIVFRSLCKLYEGMEFGSYVHATELKDELSMISARLNGGPDPGRYTSAEAIVACVERA